ncbi:unnamed protein product [Ranitomeya imitator]|uniref:Tudor domain-containing protein n=1 Tax=Ranitomeya imitator TaxID=111125 RepID=A0ABN9M0Q4_9NEOB|nr:unnamed protein product [Ranitomeya imitator]
MCQCFVARRGRCLQRPRRVRGLEAFCGDPVVVKAVETKACGKILAVEILQRSEKPLVILYDTSGDEDISINAVCLRELYDHSLVAQVQVNSSYTNVNVTNVCSDGTLFCQLPSKGLTKLNELLHKIEAEFNSKTVTSSLFVSLPFYGKICLLFHKGKWARVEITSVHSSRALDVQFLDYGSIASVKVSELREIPSRFIRDLISIPPQAKRCCLADLPLNIGMWTPDAVLWLRSTVLNCSECSIKVVKIDEAKSMLYVHLFTSRASLDSGRSLNRQITSEELWKQQKSLLPSTAATLPKDRGDAGTQLAVTRKEQSSVTKKSVEQGTTSPSIVFCRHFYLCPAAAPSSASSAVTLRSEGVVTWLVRTLCLNVGAEDAEDGAAPERSQVNIESAGGLSDG